MLIVFPRKQDLKFHANLKKQDLTFHANCFSQKTGFDISCKLSGDNLHKMSNPVSWENKKNISKMSSAENFTKNAKR